MSVLIWFISHSLDILIDSCVFLQLALITESARRTTGFPAANRLSSSKLLFFWSRCIFFARSGKALQDLFCYFAQALALLKSGIQPLITWASHSVFMNSDATMNFTIQATVKLSPGIGDPSEIMYSGYWCFHWLDGLVFASLGGLALFLFSQVKWELGWWGSSAFLWAPEDCSGLLDFWLTTPWDCRRNSDCLVRGAELPRAKYGFLSRNISVSPGLKPCVPLCWSSRRAVISVPW